MLRSINDVVEPSQFLPLIVVGFLFWLIGIGICVDLIHGLAPKEKLHILYHKPELVFLMACVFAPIWPAILLSVFIALSVKVLIIEIIKT